MLGDLHYDPRDEETFTKAQEQLALVLKEKAKEEKSSSAVVASRLVQLGDLGASSFAPGTPSCFEHAREFLGAAAVEGESFGSVPALVAGNHGKFLVLFFSYFLIFSFIRLSLFFKLKKKKKLEGTTFDEIGLRFASASSASLSISSYSGDSSDEEDDEGEGPFGDDSRRRGFRSALAAAEGADAANLEAWRSAFGQHHYWKAELGPAVLLGMSTTRFRSNSNSVHEGERREEKKREREFFVF